MCPARSSPSSGDGVAASGAASRSPVVQDARPDSAEAAARMRSSSVGSAVEGQLGVGDGAGRVAGDRAPGRPGTSRSRRAPAPARRGRTTTSSSCGPARAAARCRPAAPRRRRTRCWTSARRRSRWRGPAVADAPRRGGRRASARITASRRSRRSAGMASSTRSAARSTSPAARACRTASRPARRRRRTTSAGPPVQPGDLARAAPRAGAPQHVGEEVVVAVPAALVVERHHEQVRAAPATPASACPPGVSVTASQRGPVSRSRMEVSSRKSRTSSGWRSRTSSTR